MSLITTLARTDTCTFTVQVVDCSGTVITDLTNWTCDIQMRATRTGVLSGTIDREVTTKNVAEDSFLINLTSAETDVDPADYILGVEFNNSVTSERREKSPPLYITITEGYVR
jgi:hypothetical protein